MKNRLTLREKKFFKNYLDPKSPTFGNASKSALSAKFACRQSSFDILSNPYKQQAFMELLDSKGLSDNLLADKTLELLNANRVIGYLHNYKKNEDGEIEKIQPDEVVSNEFIEVPDNPTRMKAVEFMAKLKGHLKQETQTNVQVNVQSVLVQIRERMESTATASKQQAPQRQGATIEAETAPIATPDPESPVMGNPGEDSRPAGSSH